MSSRLEAQQSREEEQPGSRAHGDRKDDSSARAERLRARVELDRPLSTLRLAGSLAAQGGGAGRCCGNRRSTCWKSRQDSHPLALLGGRLTSEVPDAECFDVLEIVPVHHPLRDPGKPHAGCSQMLGEPNGPGCDLPHSSWLRWRSLTQECVSGRGVALRAIKNPGRRVRAQSGSVISTAAAATNTPAHARGPEARSGGSAEASSARNNGLARAPGAIGRPTSRSATDTATWSSAPAAPSSRTRER